MNEDVLKIRDDMSLYGNLFPGIAMAINAFLIEEGFIPIDNAFNIKPHQAARLMAIINKAKETSLIHRYHDALHNVKSVENITYESVLRDKLREIKSNVNNYNWIACNYGDYLKHINMIEPIKGDKNEGRCI